MASVIICDLCKSAERLAEAERTRTFTVDKNDLAIDLCEKHNTDMTTVFNQYTKRGRKKH